ncbi:MAG: helicase C-terminal domain-containing protein [Lachnospirales bacterium]
MLENKISVRNLVEFIYKNGDIDTDYLRSKTRDEQLKIMQLGIKLHEKLQKEREKEYLNDGLSYCSEIQVKCNHKVNNTEFEVIGRIDGLVVLDNTVLIEEIKTTSRKLEHLNFHSNLEYKYQAMMYAYIFGKDFDFNFIKVRITYISRETREIAYFEEDFTLEILEKFFLQTLEEYYVFVKLKKHINEKVIDTGNKVNFPFLNYRKNQRDLMKATYITIEKGKKLFVEAPTGIGKTISVLFPSIKRIAQGKEEKIFYITAKTITRGVCENSLYLLKESGLHISSITLTAKEKICFMDEVKCNPDICKYAKGHFNRINNAVLDIVENESIITRQIIEEYSQKHFVCPFEYQLDISYFSHVVIGDYNYVYNPRAQLRRFFDDNKNDYIILIDEAHNLVDRGRDMFSAQISKSDVLYIKKVSTNKYVTKSATKLNNYLVEIGSEISFNEVIPEEIELYNLVEECKYNMVKWFEDDVEAKADIELLNVFFRLDTFLKTSDYYNKKYRTLVKKDKGDLTINLMCLDPSTRLNLVNDCCKSVIFFSATLSPLEYFSSVFGGTKKDYCINLESPFNKNNLCIARDSTVSTYYKDREKNYEKIACRINEIINYKSGNYLVFFSSYVFLEKVYNLYTSKFNNNIIIQEPNMSEVDREDFLNKFKIDSKTLGFAVLGGVFSEGIDLSGKRLIGAIIVGVGLSSLNFEDDVIKDYYDKKAGTGFDYAYKFPAMNRILQSAGRVIREEEDKGVVVLLDVRYNRDDYSKLFPKHWDHIFNYNSDTIKDFWAKKGEEKI